MALAELQWGMAMAEECLLGFIVLLVKGRQGRPGSEAGRLIDIELCLPTERLLIYCSARPVLYIALHVLLYCTAMPASMWGVSTVRYSCYSLLGVKQIYRV
jgi:hypothetical protein